MFDLINYVFWMVEIIKIIPLLLIVVASHEAGHMFIALLCGVKVKAFAIGFGKILLHKEFKGIDFRICAIPFGGYCSMAGEDIGSLDHDFASKPYWKKFLILIAGVFMNLIMACICYLILYKNIFDGMTMDWNYLGCVFTKNYSNLPYYPNSWLVNLSIMNFGCFIGNLLPIVPLDGGHLWYQVIKDKLPRMVQKIINVVGIVLVVGLQIGMLYWIFS